MSFLEKGIKVWIWVQWKILSIIIERKFSFYDVNGVALVFLLLTLTIFPPFSIVPTVEFEQVNVSWDILCHSPLRRIKNHVKHI